MQLLKCTGPEPLWGEMAWLSQARGLFLFPSTRELFFFKVNAFSLEWEGTAFEAVGGWERDNTPLFPSPFCSSPVPGLLLHTSRESKKKAPSLAGRGLGVGPTCSGKGISTMVLLAWAFMAWLRPHSGLREGGKAVLFPLKCPLAPLGGGATG